MNLFGVWVWMCACVWVTELGPTRTCTGRAGTQHRMSLACVTWSYFLSLDFCRDFVLLVNQFLHHFLCTFSESFSYVYIFLAWNWLLHLNLSLAPGGNCSWWCGGWACCGLGAFAFFCPLSLHCIFCILAQLLGLVFPPLPVFCFWWLGSECGFTSASQPASRQWRVECLVCLEVFIIFFFVLFCFFWVCLSVCIFLFWPD